MKNSILRYFTIFTLIGIVPLLANPDDEPIAAQLNEALKKPYFSVGMILQVVGDGQIERVAGGNNGFNISNMRLSFSGELDKKFGYFLNTNFINSPAILDAKMYLRFNENATFTAGLFKAPFSKEFLTSAAGIDMVNRSQVVSSFAPGRQIGMQIGTKSDILSIDAGVFNGNGYGGNNNDGDDFMFASRLGITPSMNNGTLEAGFNIAYSKDSAVRILGSTFRGKRTLMGGDIRLTIEKLLLAGEFIFADLESGFSPNSSSFNPFGFHLTGGIMVNDNNQLLFRVDQIDFDAPNASNTLLIFGYNLWPTSLTELQVNYIINTDLSEFKYHQLLINAQVAF